MSTIAREEKRRKRLVWFLVGSCLTLAFAIARISETRTNTINSGSLEWLLPLGAAFALFIPIVVAVIAAYPRRNLRNAIRELARLSTISQINRLFDLNRSLTDERTSREVLDALSHALLSVNASDAQKIDEVNRDYLHRTLAAVPEPNPRMRRRQYVSFCEAIIRAMEQIGDERALKAMERIAKMSGRSPARLRLKRAAADCLPALRERIREEAAPDLLLRAAVSESDAELLRPTTNTAQPDSVTLLRPTQ